MSLPKFYLISPNYAESGALETLPDTPGLQIIKNDQLENSAIRFNPADLVCITSEASIEIVKKRLDDPTKENAINMLKDKYQFRKILKEIYPEYRFEKLAFNDLSSLRVDAKSILKPSKGCFGTAVKVLTPDSDLELIKKEIKQELAINSAVLSSDVLSDNEFILEEYINGEEYAVDMFYDAEGEPHIVNAYHHPMPMNNAYLHMIYYSGRQVFDQIYDKAIEFFRALNDVLNVRNFVMHCEFRFSDNKLQPIEINSMRFGGMGLGNMLYYSIGINPYECFQSGQSPDWDSVWSSKKHADSLYAFFIAYNGTEVDKTKEKPYIAKLKNEFSKVIHEQLFDYQNQLSFGVFYLAETQTNITKLLSIEFNDYFEPKY